MPPPLWSQQLTLFKKLAAEFRADGLWELLQVNREQAAGGRGRQQACNILDFLVQQTNKVTAFSEDAPRRHLVRSSLKAVTCCRNCSDGPVLRPH